MMEIKHKISVKVTDEDNNGISNASVIIDGTSKTTGSAGGCSFTDITDGEHTITVTADTYNEYTGTITVSEDNTSFNITLTK